MKKNDRHLFNQRERRLALAAVILFAAVGLYAGLIRPAQRRLATLQRILPEKRAALRQLRQDAQTFLSLQTRLSGFQAETPGDQVALLSVLEDVGRETGVMDHITQMSQSLWPQSEGYQEACVTLTMQKITLKQWFAFMNGLKKMPLPVRLKSMEMYKHPAAPDVLHVDMTLHQIRRIP